MTRCSVVALCTLLAACTDAPVSHQGAASPVSFDGAEPATHDARVAHGARLADVLSCTSCHGADLTGGDYGEDADGGFIFAPNLTRAVQRLSDRELEALLTRGEHPSRERVWYMPSKTLQRLSRADLDALVQYLRNLEPTGRDWPVPQEGETTLALVELGVLETSADRLSAYRYHQPPEIAGTPPQGRYIASVTCAECHGPALNGEWGSAPDLKAMLGHHDAASLTALLEGHGQGGGLMGMVAARNLSALTPHEREALVAYLVALSHHDG